MNTITLDDPHQTRADELRTLHYHELARRILECGQPAFFNGYPEKAKCKIRVCPSCAEDISRNNANEVISAVRKFENPVIFLVTMPEAYKLKESIIVFRKALASIRRLKNFKNNVRGGVSAIETRYNPESKCWQVHCHLILDVFGNGLTEEYLQARWSKYTRISGTNRSGNFGYHNDPKVDIRNLKELARYLCKRVTWCPQHCHDGYRELSDFGFLRVLDEIMDAIKHRQLKIAWGNGRIDTTDCKFLKQSKVNQNTRNECNERKNRQSENRQSENQHFDNQSPVQCVEKWQKHERGGESGGGVQIDRISVDQGLEIQGGVQSLARVLNGILESKGYAAKAKNAVSSLPKKECANAQS